MKNAIRIALLLLAASAHAKVIDVSKHGIAPGKDVTLELSQLIRSLEGEDEVTLHFPKGQYDFYPDNAFEMYRAVANHDNGLKRMAFPLFDRRNITIDGNGSLFMFHGRIVPFTLENVKGATLRNFTIDFIRPFHAELTVLETDEQSGAVTVGVDTTHYPYAVEGDMAFFDRLGQKDSLAGQNIVFDPETRSPIYLASQYGLRHASLKVEEVSSGRLKLHDAFTVLPPVGSVLVAYGSTPTSRLCHAIQITNSKDVVIEDVTILAAGGMGLIVERTENVRLQGMKVTSAEGRLVSTRADATHFIGCKGLIELEDCVFEHMLDDGINVHGAYVPVVRRIEGNTFLCEISHFQQWGFVFAEPGDQVALLSRETILPFFETSVAEVVKLNEKRFLVTLKELPAELPNVPLSLENLTWNADLVMRNNKIRENRARSVLVTTKGSVLIENNYFSSQMHGILIEGDNNYWYESGAVEDVIIRNNAFENIGFGIPKGYPLLASPMLTKEQRFGDERYHRNIRFTGNTIRSFNGNFIKARTVEGLVVSDNKVEFSTDYPVMKPHLSLQLEYCNNVDFLNNSATGFGSELTLTQSEACENVRVENNSGFN